MWKDMSGAAARTGELPIKIIRRTYKNRILGVFASKHQKKSRVKCSEIRPRKIERC